MNKKTIYLATDHAGFEYKETVKEILENNFSENFNVVDCGALKYEATDDYPDFISLAVEKVSANPENSLAIIFGGSGQGEAMVANRYPNVRATTYYHFDPEIIKLSREHNNGNILSIGARFLSNKEMLESVLFWLEIPFVSGERHDRRIDKIEFEGFGEEGTMEK